MLKLNKVPVHELLASICSAAVGVPGYLSLLEFRVLKGGWLMVMCSIQTAGSVITPSIYRNSCLLTPPLPSYFMLSYLFLSPPPIYLFCCSVSPHPGRSCLFPFEDGFLNDSHGDPTLTHGLNSPTRCQNGERMERYSRKVFVGGLPPDIDEGKETPAALFQGQSPAGF